MKKVLITVLLTAEAVSCTSMRKLENIRSSAVAVNLAMAPIPGASPYEVPIDTPVGDTLVVKGADGKNIYILKAVRDETSGEMVANDVIQAACVTATFRNIAERDGKVSLEFRITVPEVLLDSKWQLRLTPHLLLPSGDVELDKVIVTGQHYRKEQLMGYEKYERFLATIISDTTLFLDKVMLERFIERYIPNFDIPEEEILKHYTDFISIRRNDARKARKSIMFDRYVKVPIQKAGVRLDTIVSFPDGALAYDYIQPMETMPGLKKVSIAMSGGLYDGGQRIYSIPMEDSITFYISTLSSLAENRVRYLTKVISRRVEATSSYGIQFRTGSSEIDWDSRGNAEELERIKCDIAEIGNEEFELDSVVISAASSPDGSFSLNKRLSESRGRNMAAMLRKEMGRDAGSIRFVSRSLPEDWETLSDMVHTDASLNAGQKEMFAERMKIANPDARENAMRKDSYFRYLKDSLFPELRRVKMDFCLHRKGMVKDTIETTVPDTVYSNGLLALKNGDYLTAAGMLGEYEDYNAALALSALNKNHTALAILEKCATTPQSDYLKAILFARLGDEQNAVQHYLQACSKIPSYIHRGNLDPEISSLIRKYNLNGL